MRNKERKQRRLYFRAMGVRMGIRVRPHKHRGVLVLKSEIPPETLARFREHWDAMIRGAAWTMPVGL